MLGEKLKEMRESKHLLQREVASMLEMDGAMYNKIERGAKCPNREQLTRLASVFDAKESDLLTLWVADKVDSVLNKEQSVASDALSMVCEHYNS